MYTVIRIGSRESALAVKQAEIIKELIEREDPAVRAEIITMKTTGDRILDKSLEKIGGKGLFVKELDRALLEGKIDLAVHSLKDMPMPERDKDLGSVAVFLLDKVREGQLAVADAEAVYEMAKRATAAQGIGRPFKLEPIEFELG